MERRNFLRNTALMTGISIIAPSVIFSNSANEVIKIKPKIADLLELKRKIKSIVMPVDPSSSVYVEAMIQPPKDVLYTIVLQFSNELGLRLCEHVGRLSRAIVLNEFETPEECILTLEKYIHDFFEKQTNNAL